MYLVQRFIGILGVLSICSLVHAVPYVPSDGKQILETLPNRFDPLQQAFSRMRAQLARNPDDLTLALQLAQMYISASRTDGDPRYLGYAQAVLAPWWTRPHPPEAVLLQRAIILQSTHQFASALTDLDAVLKSDPLEGQAWMTRATVLTVLGEYSQAKEACGQLHNLTYEIVVQTCAANIGSVTGEAQSSYTTLSTALAAYPNLDPSLRIWVLTALGEMAARLNYVKAAEAHFHNAMILDQPDGYLLGAFSDFLLDQKRPAEVIQLLKSRTRNDALLLRYALALKAQGSPATSESIESLRQRFNAARMRGDTVHQREQARFELHLLNDPDKALRTALSNWQVQKEAADLRILLEAASAAKDQKATALALDWISSTHFEDHALNGLVEAARRKV